MEHTSTLGGSAGIHLPFLLTHGLERLLVKICYSSRWCYPSSCLLDGFMEQNLVDVKRVCKKKKVFFHVIRLWILWITVFKYSTNHLNSIGISRLVRLKAISLSSFICIVVLILEILNIA